ncbi:monothiol glutaredoxin GRX5, partial [Ascoidea rubescens DSM 1968]
MFTRAFARPAFAAPGLLRSFKQNGPLSVASSVARFLSTETKEAIEKAISSAPVVLFMKGTPNAPQCGFSRSTIVLLGRMGIDPDKFAAYNVLEDPDLREGIKEYSNWPTIPQLYLNKEFVGGCDIVTSMAQSGDLLQLLESEDVLLPDEDAE